MNILLIEPDKILAVNIRKVLRKAGHKVTWQVDPQEALDSADTDAPQAIILDLILATRGGVEFLYEFRSYPDWQAVPVIVFSSLSAEELTAAVSGLSHLNIGAYHYKPHTNLSDLVKTIESILQPVSV